MVTGATGKVGRALVERLAGAGEQVRAVSRDPARAGLPAGVDVVAGDVTDPASIAAAAAGADAAFLLWPFFGRSETLRYAPAAVAALRVPRIVHLSAQPAEAAPDSPWALVEQEVERTAAEWTVLRPSGFAGNTLGWADQIRAGDVVRYPHGSAVRSLIDERDIAAVAATALTGAGHAGRKYVLTGPERLTQVEQVEVIGAVLGRRLRWEEPSRAEARDILGGGDFAEAALAGWARFTADPEVLTDTVPALLGRPATPYGQWVADRADAFR